MLGSIARIVYLFVSVILIAGSAAANEQALNVAEWTSAVEILKGAKAAIIEHGWQQGSTESVTPECVTTAMERSWLRLKKTMVDFDYAKLAMSHAVSAPPAARVTTKDDPLSVPYWGRYLMYWNDTPGRTEKQVLAAFDVAIAYAEDQKKRAERAGLHGEDLARFDATMMARLGLLKRSKNR